MCEIVISYEPPCYAFITKKYIFSVVIDLVQHLFKVHKNSLGTVVSNIGAAEETKDDAGSEENVGMCLIGQENVVLVRIIIQAGEFLFHKQSICGGGGGCLCF